MSIIKSLQLKDHPSLIIINEFFNCRTVDRYLEFLEQWMELIMGNQDHVCNNNPSDLLFFYEKLVELFEAGSQFCGYVWSDQSLTDQGLLQSSDEFLSHEKELLNSYPKYLSKGELNNPLMAIKFIFSECDFDFYKTKLHHWLEEGLSNHHSDNNRNLIFPFYSHSKKLIEACWLIHERLISKNSFKPLLPKPLGFEGTCPLLLRDDHFENPYLEIEHFYSGSSLGEYKNDIKAWFKAALTEELKYQNSSDLVYFNNQIVQLLHAGYLIIKNELSYQGIRGYISTGETFKEWIFRVRDQQIANGRNVYGEYLVNLLEEEYQKDPVKFLKESLTLPKIKDLRYGLQEWLYCALHENSSINTMESRYLFDQYEQLEKLLEAFFLLVAGHSEVEKGAVNL